MRQFSLLLILLTCLPALAQKSVPQAMCGTWQYFAGGGTYTGGGYSTSRSFTLYPNGTYEFHGETSNSGGNGMSNGGGSDTGHWWVEGNLQYAQLVARNASGQVMKFELELRNHPKTHDPMIVLDGDCYVTATQRQPWPDL